MIVTKIYCFLIIRVLRTCSYSRLTRSSFVSRTWSRSSRSWSWSWSGKTWRTNPLWPTWTSERRATWSRNLPLNFLTRRLFQTLVVQWLIFFLIGGALKVFSIIFSICELFFTVPELSIKRDVVKYLRLEGPTVKLIHPAFQDVELFTAGSNCNLPL